MSETDLDRVREDLITMREAGKFDKPYAAEDVPLLIFMSISGLAGSLAAWQFSFNRFAVLASVSPFVLCFLWLAWKRQRNRSSRPGLWRETRNSLLALIVLVPLTIAWMKWEQFSGIPRQSVGAAAVFFVGVGCIVVSVIDRDRIAYIVSGIVLLAFGLAIPLLEPKQIAIAGGLAIFATGAGAALIISLQLRTNQSDE